MADSLSDPVDLPGYRAGACGPPRHDVAPSSPPDGLHADKCQGFALKFGPSTFGVFDAFADGLGRQAHLHGPIAAALMANAVALFSAPPTIEKIDLLAAKLPG